MVVIKTVLKSGGIYSPAHVQRILDMIRQYVHCPYRFVCYTDVAFDIDGCERRPLLTTWPGWWAKLEIFRELEPSFYIDLDMDIIGDITDMVTYPVGFMALRNMNPRIAGIGSALMRWDDDMRWLLEKFAQRPNMIMRRHRVKGTAYWGDQGYIWEMTSKQVRFFQQAFPGRIRRFCDPRGGDIRVFYGRFKPWGIAEDFGQSSHPGQA